MGERFEVAFEIRADSPAQAQARAEDITVEQTLEMSPALVADTITEAMAGRVQSLAPLQPGRHRAVVSFAVETTGGELTQFLNVLFGNISLKPGLRITDITWAPSLLKGFGGPGHGMPGLRAATGAGDRPLLCTALKPMGLSAGELAQRCEAFARGGIDIIKDDHGLADQPSAPFRERVERCQQAVTRANTATGGRSLYFPNVTSGPGELPARLAAAQEAGCRGVLLNAWVTGLATLSWIRERTGLMVMAHPALTGAYFGADHGITVDVLLGDLFRVAGADAVIYPNTGGRFGLSEQTCEALNHRLRRPLGALRPAAPVPAGGMDLDSIPHWARRYGPDTVFLVGGGLYTQGDLEAAARQFRDKATASYD